MIEVLNKEKFSQMVERLVIEKKIPYIDAIVWWCDEHEFEIEDTAKLLCPLIKEKIKVEAQDLNYLEKSARLPI
jgi:hypothetical protein